MLQGQKEHTKSIEFWEWRGKVRLTVTSKSIFHSSHSANPQAKRLAGE